MTNLYGRRMTRFGPIDRSRENMLTWATNEQWAAKACPHCCVLCKDEQVEQLTELGAEPIPSARPAEAFWDAFFDCVKREGSTYGQTVPFKTHSFPPRLIPPLGGARIWPGATVSATASVDPGVFGEDTEIHHGAQIDNLVHVAHSVVVGHDAHVVAGTVLGGWCEIGARTFVGIGCKIRDGVKIGKDCHVGMGSVVIDDVPDGAKVKGLPAEIYDWSIGYDTWARTRTRGGRGNE